MYHKNKAFDLLVEQLEQIPSIGKKSALKIAYTLAVENKILALNIAHCIENATNAIQRCEMCGGISEARVCHICSDETRRHSGMLCIVGSARDILTIEEVGIFEGLYLVIDEIGSVDFTRIRANIARYHTREILFAFSPSLASDTMMLYIEDKLQDLSLRFYKIAQGVPTGVGLDNIDKLSLSRAIEAKTKI